MEATMVALAPSASSLSVMRSGASVASHQTSFMVGSGGVALKGSCGVVEERSGSERRGVLRVEAKGRRTAGVPGRQPNRQQMPAMPPMDADDNPKFVLFIRTLNVPRWYPLSVVTGGTTAKMMVGAMKNDWGKKLYEGTLTRNIAGVIYKDERAIRQTAIKQYPVLKSATGFQYGYKIMDPANPKSALFASDVVTIPPKEELNSVVDKVKDFFGKIGDSFGSLGSLPAGSEEQAGESKDKK
ncbi:hypothetical protein M758_2G114200 [Ceratodon purpureus]|nr:hypothetical protein M758_2G114200 [Ceratodon purpureus]